MAEQIKFRRAPCGFNHFPVTGRFRGHLFTLLQVMQPLRINQLFEMRQSLQTGRILQRVAQRSNLLQPRLCRRLFTACTSLSLPYTATGASDFS